MARTKSLAKRNPNHDQKEFGMKIKVDPETAETKKHVAVIKTGLLKKKPRKANTPLSFHRELMKDAKNTKNLMFRAPFERLVREIIYESNPDFKLHLTPGAIDTLQCATEAYISKIFLDSNLIASNAKRQTISLPDFQLAYHFQDTNKNPRPPTLHECELYHYRPKSYQKNNAVKSEPAIKTEKNQSHSVKDDDEEKNGHVKKITSTLNKPTHLVTIKKEKKHDSSSEEDDVSFSQQKQSKPSSIDDMSDI